MLAPEQQLSLARYTVDQMTHDQREVLVWDLIRCDTWAGRFMFELMQVKNLGPSTALEVLIEVIKVSQDERYRTV